MNEVTVVEKITILFLWHSSLTLIQSTVENIVIDSSNMNFK